LSKEQHNQFESTIHQFIVLIQNNVQKNADKVLVRELLEV